MAKKRDLRYLLKNVPSPTTIHIKIITILFAILMFSVLVYIGSVTYTGLVIGEFNEPQFTTIKNQNIFVSNQFEVLEIQKTPNSVLDINLESDIFLNIFVEIDDCPYWLNGKDKDNIILYTVNNIKNGDFKIGNPPENTIQQIDLYKTDYLCLILINREFPNTGNANIQYKEIDINKWKIV